MKAINHRNFLHLAIPFTLSTVTQPLLGAVDTAVVGRLDSPAFIGGVAIGTVIFNTLYWLFGFLRVATSGFSAQSLASQDHAPKALAWLRPLALAAIIGLTFICLQHLIISVALNLYDADALTAGYADIYFNILIWGAPLVLISYVNLGWLMGRGHVREVMWLQIGTNSLNIALDFIMVNYFDAAVAGVAWATLISQAAAFGLGLFFIFQRISAATIIANLAGIRDLSALKKLAAVNRDLFIRTACLLTMTNIFVAKGSSMGADFLAANAILFQLQYLIAYLFDGLANAAAVFAGQFTGTGDKDSFLRTRSVTHIHLFLLSVILLIILTIGRNSLPFLFTDLEPVLAICHNYFIYLLLFTLTMPLGLVYYGFYVGATFVGPVRNSLLIALLLFIPAEIFLIPRLHNHGLWIAFVLFCAARSLILLVGWKQLLRQTFDQQNSSKNAVPQPVSIN